MAWPSYLAVMLNTTDAAGALSVFITHFILYKQMVVLALCAGFLWLVSCFSIY